MARFNKTRGYKRTMRQKNGIINLVHRFHDMVEEEKNPIMKGYYMLHFKHLFRQWFNDIDLIVKRKVI